MPATILAASLDQADVKAAVDASSIGDTILLPSGTATWTTLYSNVGLTITDRILRGAGKGVTTIIDQCGATTWGSVISVGSNVEICHFTLRAADSGYSSNLIMAYSSTGVNFHDLAIEYVIVRGFHFQSGTDGVHCTGVIHHCDVTAKSYAPSYGNGVFQLFTIEGPDNANSSTPPDQSVAAGSWSSDPGFGTGSAIFIEDCVISQDAQGDATVETYVGGKVVVRRNTITNFLLGVHGNDSSVRSGHTFEIYENTITNNLGNYQQGTVLCRGGTGLVWGNDITQTGANNTTGNVLLLQSYRSAGNLNAETGQHTGEDGASVLTAVNTWGATATNGSNVAGQTLYNVTTGASGIITSNNQTTITATLSGGSRQTWNTGDTYKVVTSRFPYNDGQLDGHYRYDGNALVFSGTHTGSNGEANLTDSSKTWGANELDGYGDYATDNNLQSYFIWNLTSGAGGRITANTSNTATVALAGGTRQTWNTGDQYSITFGYPGLDQCGWSGPTTFGATSCSQVLNPLYSWDNTYNGAADQLPFAVSYTNSSYTTIAQPDSTLIIQENREYYNATERPGYTPYQYPHPLVGLPLAPSALSASAISTSAVSLGWTNNASDADGIYVERSSDNSTFTQIASLASTATTYSATGLAAGTQYWFRVRAYNTNGNSAYSNTATSTTSSSLPPLSSGVSLGVSDSFFFF